MATTLSSVLRSSDYFAGLAPEELDALEQSMIVQTFLDEHCFIEEGRTGKDLFLILSGKVSVTKKRANGRGLEIDKTISRGALFGIVALADPGRRTATCRAVGRVTVASLPGSIYSALRGFDSFVVNALNYALARQLAADLRALAGFTLNGLRKDDAAGTRRRMREYLG